jgi:2-dehydro-3-deoxyphosphogluconate aldolase / (4S)-4-hydroxy-2-oxoglutarate aldolase
MKILFEQIRVIPVLVFPDPNHAAATAGALIDGGLPILEVTLRTDSAWTSLANIIAAYPDAHVGVGTVLDEDQMKRAKDEGAKFAVSPGFDPLLARAAQELDLFYLPGVATASELMQARRAGFRFVKFFPAEAAGGKPMIQSFASPFRDMSFCPTGGVNAENMADYLALSNVACVGGSWIATAQDMAAGDWTGITAKAQAARSATAKS